MIMARMRQVPELRDINSDQQDKGLQSYLSIDRDTAGRLGVSIRTLTMRSATLSASGRSQQFTKV